MVIFCMVIFLCVYYITFFCMGKKCMVILYGKNASNFCMVIFVCVYYITFFCMGKNVW